jgi:aminopeptidase Y
MRPAAISLGLIGGVSALHIPPQALEQLPLGDVGKELVSSEALQSQIHVSNLLDRAKILYGLAERSIDEYNHPTRVIGSKGTSKRAHICGYRNSYTTHRALGYGGLHLLDRHWSR